MTRRQIPELNYLLELVEKRYGRPIKTSSDFEALSVVMEREINELLSASTLKRLWGYVTLNPSPRSTTLDILSRYIGYKNFEEFRRWLRTTPDFESAFFSARTLNSRDLTPGSIVAIGWNPDRVVEMKYLGDHQFEVTKNQNSQLREGDRFEVGCFMVGYPLYIPSVLRDGGYTASYVAGKNEGLSCADLISLPSGE